MAWIELHQTMLKHEKTLVLARILGLSKLEVAGLLDYLWLWALDVADIDGRLGRLVDKDIEMALDLPIKTGKLVPALVESGFIERVNDGLIIHNWYRYAGKLNERRAADRMRKNSTGIPQENQRKTEGNPTLPYLTVPYSNDTEDTTTDERPRLEANAIKDLIKAYARYFGADNANEAVTGLVNDFGYMKAYDCIHKAGKSQPSKHIDIPAAYIRAICEKAQSA